MASKAWRKQHQEKGLCIECRDLCEPGKRRCAWHLAQHRIHQTRYHHTAKGRAAKARKVKILFQKRRAARRAYRCVSCNRPVGTLSRQMCDRHARKRQQYEDYRTDYKR